MNSSAIEGQLLTNFYYYSSVLHYSSPVVVFMTELQCGTRYLLLEGYVMRPWVAPLHCTVLHCTALHLCGLHYTALHYKAVDYTALHYTALF